MPCSTSPDLTSTVLVAVLAGFSVVENWERERDNNLTEPSPWERRGKMTINEEGIRFEKTILFLNYICNYKIAIGVVFVSKFMCLFISHYYLLRIQWIKWLLPSPQSQATWIQVFFFLVQDASLFFFDKNKMIFIHSNRDITSFNTAKNVKEESANKLTTSKLIAYNDIIPTKIYDKIKVTGTSMASGSATLTLKSSIE